jgi:hypothetical protein
MLENVPDNANFSCVEALRDEQDHAQHLRCRLTGVDDEKQLRKWVFDRT